jgi:putative ABC transport system permease protein
MGRDVVFAWRLLRRQPIFTTVALVTLGLGIGINTAIFSTTYAVILKPLPFPDAARLVELRAVRQFPSPDQTRYFSLSDRNDILAQAPAIEALASALPVSVTLTGVREPALLAGLQVSGDFFGTHAIAPLLGRPITPADTELDDAQVVVLGHRLWMEQFGGDPLVVGRDVMLAVQPRAMFTPFTRLGKPYRVVGVMPPHQRFPVDGELWVPLPARAYTNGMSGSARSGRLLLCVARVKPGATLAQLNTELHAIGQRLARTFPDTNGGWDFTSLSVRDALSEDYRLSLWLLQGAVGLVLLLACVSVSGLMIARNRGRRREVAIREALGATRAQLVRQFLVESVMLSLCGGALGVALAVWCVSLVRTSAPVDTPRLDEIALSWPVVSYAFITALLCALVVGIAPAVQLTAPELGTAMKAPHSRSGTWDPFRLFQLKGLLIGLEIAIAFPVVVASLLMLQSLDRLTHVDFGYRRENVLTMNVKLSASTCHTFPSCVSGVNEILEQTRAVPGVVSAAIVGARPLGVQFFALISTREHWEPANSDAVSTEFQVVTSQFFSTLGIPLRAGRVFDDHDSAGGPLVAVVNEALARRQAATSAIGQHLNLAPIGRRDLLEVVGVVGDVRDVSLSRPPQPTFYVPFQQADLILRTSLLVKTSGDTLTLERALRQLIGRIDRNAAVTDVATLDQVVSDTVSDQHFRTFVLTVLGGLSLSLALLGIYGLISYSVSDRLKEFGIRLALGAQRHDLIRLVLGESLSTVGWGLAVGIGGAIGAGRYLRSVLFEIAPTDPVSLASVMVLIIAVAMVGYYIPARRAARVDPLVVLRRE